MSWKTWLSWQFVFFWNLFEWEMSGEKSAISFYDFDTMNKENSNNNETFVKHYFKVLADLCCCILHWIKKIASEKEDNFEFKRCTEILRSNFNKLKSSRIIRNLTQLENIFLLHCHLLYNVIRCSTSNSDGRQRTYVCTHL